MTLQRFIFFVSFTMFSSGVHASGRTGDDFDWANALAILFIVLCVLGAIWLSRYVKRQQRNNVLPMLWMNSSILKGRLLYMVTMLEDSASGKDKHAGIDYQACSFCIVALERQGDIADLVKQSGLGRRGARKIEKGFIHLNQAVTLYKTLQKTELEYDRGSGRKLYSQFHLEISSTVKFFESVIQDIYE